MKVKIKFSELRELVEKSLKHKELKKTNNALLEQRVSLGYSIEELKKKLNIKNEEITHLTQEIKELNKENNKLKKLAEGLAERKMPKFWFGDKVYTNITTFKIRNILFNGEKFFYSDGDTCYTEEDGLKLVEV